MAVAPENILPASAKILDADFSLQDGHIVHRSPYSAKSFVVRPAPPVLRGRLRLRVATDEGDDEVMSWLEAHALSPFGVEIWRFDGGHDLTPLPEITASTLIAGGRARWTLDAPPDAAWLNRLAVVSGRVVRIISINGSDVVVTPGFTLAPPVTPEPPETATIRVQQITPLPLGLRFAGGISQDLIIEVIETPGHIAGRGPIAPVEIPPGALTWMKGGLRWLGGYLVLPAPSYTPNALRSQGGELRWMGGALTYNPV